MKGLILLYWGTVFLMYLSQTYYPVETSWMIGRLESVILCCTAPMCS